ncbi:putative transporter [Cercospora beticola]|uniref:Putative transporter n=1 Tax=Cercospora beticola TaxID=122368 RepID=A0A2G5IAF5_CERBT|nr:putative transporter [Cercospora beticola]PIB01827.1 putative transporter [Cercospora beticola]WPA96050.1 hypothetical protein RHO25_000656 [Cercospora beticola]
MADHKKEEIFEYERKQSERSVPDSNDDILNLFTEEEKKKLMWRIDVRLCLTLGLMYCVSLMDRTNLGIAVVGGMGVDLKLIKFRYSTIVLVFFITYVLLQPPATVVLRKVGPKLFLPLITLLWGLTMMTFGFVIHWWQMIPLRIILGAFEAGFFPGCAYLLSCWYPRYEVHKRNAVFFLIGNLSAAFSGILGYGLLQMDGLGDLGDKYGQHYGPTKKNPHLPFGIKPGIAGWRWIFIIQGLITVLVAAGGAFFISDFPENAAKRSRFIVRPFLTEKEAAYIVARIEKDRDDAITTPFKLSSYLRHGLDIKVWGFAVQFMLTATVGYAIAYFLPIILHDSMGFDLAMSECLISPPYVLAAIWMFGCAVVGDKYHIRGPLIIMNAIIGLIGLPLLGFAKTPAVRYFGVFLATTGPQANIPCMMSFQANNIRGQWKRAFSSATMVGAGGVGGIIGSTVFRSQDAPNYRPGMWTTIGCGILTIIITAWLDWRFWKANKRADRGEEIIEGLEGFRYTL